MHFDRKKYSNDQLLHLYKQLLLPRLVEEKMLILLRQGKISKWFSGIGQEAISVGATLALQPDEWIMPLHRNLGIFTTRQIPLNKLFAQWQGYKEGYSKGRERSFHFGSKEHYICGMISHLGPQLAIADGVALAYKLKNQQKITLAFTGEGGTSEGDFHEALNLAAVWDLPVIFLVENNGYALSTPTSEQYRCEKIIDKAKGYGIESVCIDGNNILEVHSTLCTAREYCINKQKPYLIECVTFRMRGHEEASGVKYIPNHLFEEWKQKDPIQQYESYLLKEKILSSEDTKHIREKFHQYIETEIQQGFSYSNINPSIREEIEDVYKSSSNNTNTTSTHLKDQEKNVTTLRFVDAIKDALQQSMQQHPNLILMGQDIGEYGGAFKITEGLIEKYGKERVRNTPLCESAIVGAALGLSLEGFKSIVEMQFADFVTCGFNQIVNNLAKIHYRWGQHADVVIRMPTGAGVGAGPFHSQSNEAWFTHVPGLKIVYPSTPYDAKGLLNAAINDLNPILYFEHKALYRSISGLVPSNYYTIPIGKAQVVNKGNDMSIITYGAGVHWALECAKAHTHLSIYILDLRTLLPLDYDAIAQGVKATGRTLILHEDTLFGGFGGEIAAWIVENCFEYLDAPVMRCASLDTPVPFNIELENQFLAKSRLTNCIKKIMEY